MNDAEGISEVCWEDFWDKTIEQLIEDGSLGFEGDRGHSLGNWTLYHPRRLLVDERTARVDGVAAALSERGARLDADDSRESEEARATAARLGLSLYVADNERLVDAVRAINRVVARSASLDHVLIGGPARWGGDSVPAPIADPGTVPGRDEGLGQGITVAVLDTGIAEVSFAVQAGAGDAEIPDDDGDGDRDAPAGHGTHVAGLVLSVAAGARIVARRILTGTAGIASDLAVARGLLESADAHIINCSFSGPVLDDGSPLAVERALAQLPPTTVVVACAGNQGTERQQWPAASKRVIAVGAVQRRDGDGAAFDRPDFSNFGGWVDCCAPGVDVESTFIKGFGFEGFASWTGTSMACPQVAGAIAALATADGDARGAAYRLVQDPARPRIPGLGAIVDPLNLP